jgi:hypothetical protein
VLSCWIIAWFPPWQRLELSLMEIRTGAISVTAG